MSTVRVNQIQDTSTNVAANISGGVVTFTNTPIGAGKILQVVDSVINTGSSNSQVTARTAYLTVTITPSSTSSKIYVGAQGAGSVIWGSNGILQSEIWRGDITTGTVISVAYNGLSGSGPANGNEHYITGQNFIVDSPNTTNAVTYTFAAVKGSGGTTSARIMGGTAFPITMFAMEIGG